MDWMSCWPRVISVWPSTYYCCCYFWCGPSAGLQYNDVIMSASQITGLPIVHSTVIQAQIKENIKAPRHWSLRGEFTGDQWISRTNPHKGPVTRKMFPFDCVIMWAHTIGKPLLHRVICCMLKCVEAIYEYICIFCHTKILLIRRLLNYLVRGSFICSHFNSDFCSSRWASMHKKLFRSHRWWWPYDVNLCRRDSISVNVKTLDFCIVF